jgi:sec-independent protein translocase protein TatA
MGALTGHLPEIIIVLVVILIIWGPGKLPDVGAALGKGIREFRKASSEAHDTVMGTTTSTAAQPTAIAQVAAAYPAQPAEPVTVQADAAPHTPVSG